MLPDGVTALGRFRCTMQAGLHKDYGPPRQWWEGGIYENVYRKVDGVWRIHVSTTIRNGTPISRPAGRTRGRNMCPSSAWPFPRTRSAPTS